METLKLNGKMWRGKFFSRCIFEGLRVVCLFISKRLIYMRSNKNNMNVKKGFGATCPRGRGRVLPPSWPQKTNLREPKGP